MGSAEPYMISVWFVVQCGNASPDDSVGQEPRGVLGDRAHVLAHREPAGLAGRDPGSDRRVAVGHPRQRRDRLTDKSLGPIGAVVMVERLARDQDRHIGALARIERLLVVGILLSSRP